jgi:hypothetical protein
MEKANTKIGREQKRSLNFIKFAAPTRVSQKAINGLRSAHLAQISLTTQSSRNLRTRYDRAVFGAQEQD